MDNFFFFFQILLLIINLQKQTFLFIKASDITALRSTHFLKYSSVQFSHSVVSYSLWPHGLQHVRPPCSSPTPRVYSNSCPLSWLCQPTISSSVIPFSFCLQSFPESGSFPMSQFFTSGGQSIGVSASASSHFNEHSGLISFRMDWLDLLIAHYTSIKLKM